MTVAEQSTLPAERIDRTLGRSFSVVGLFSGIGGIEEGLRRAGHHSVLLCEIHDGAAAVLRERFPEVPLVGDILGLEELPRCELVAAGFPCQDLSQAGRKIGIGGNQSGLVKRVFELLEDARHMPKWLLLENVPFMLQLDRGDAMRYLTGRLDELGFRWAYRIVDARAFGLPQRRKRVLLLASRTDDPREILFRGDVGESRLPDHSGLACGFYWTEGRGGLGWAVDAVPTLKGGSTIGIPSAPAIWMPDGLIGTPDIRDAERLQGFEPDWTLPAASLGRRQGDRWKLVGNAVSVRVAEWVGSCLLDPQPFDPALARKLAPAAAWPIAAAGDATGKCEIAVSSWPVRMPYQSLLGFLRYPLKPLSERATAGFLDRTGRSTLRFPEGFLQAVQVHLQATRTRAA